MEKNRVLEKKVEDWYKWRTGKTIDLSNPKTFNEKINWLKVYDSTELKGRFADKYSSRKILEKLLGKDYSIPIIGVWDYFDQIDFNKLPNQFVLKTTHGSAMNIVVKDKNTFNKKDAKEKFDKWLNTDFGSISHEYHYKYIKPRIIAEEYVGNGNDLDECKVHCFNGEAKVIKIIKRNLVDKKSYEAFYDKEWNRTSCMYSSFEQIEGEVEKPKVIDEIIEISERLGILFKFVRVDFYLIDDKFYLGELTFTPCAGVGSWKNESDNQLAGSWINLNEN